VEAAYAFVRLGRDEMLSHLDAALKSDPGARKAGILAAYYLTKLDRASGLAFLEALIKKPDSGYAVVAADTLGKTGNPRAVLPLVEYAKSEDSALRLSVARGLGLLGGSRAVAALKKLRDDPNAGVRNAAIASLTQLGEID